MISVQERQHAPAVLEPSEHTVTLRDGAELFYRAWLPEEPTRKALLLFHRGHEHSGRWQETVAALGLDDVAVFAWDQRGHGLSSAERGTAPDLATVIRDVEEWVHHLSHHVRHRTGRHGGPRPQPWRRDRDGMGP